VPALPAVGPTRVATFALPEENLPPGTPPLNEWLARLLYPQSNPAARPERERPLYWTLPGVAPTLTAT
jgi:hypothetical protein